MMDLLYTLNSLNLKEEVEISSNNQPTTKKNNKTQYIKVNEPLERIFSEYNSAYSE